MIAFQIFFVSLFLLLIVELISLLYAVHKMRKADEAIIDSLKELTNIMKNIIEMEKEMRR